MGDGDIIDAPVLVALHRYWRGKFAGAALPARAAIDPAEIKPHLPWIFMVGVEHAPLRFTYRLIGTGIVEFLHRDYTGRPVDETTYGVHAARMFEIFESAVLHRDVTAVRCPVFYAAGREYRDVCWTMMPLAANGRDVDYLFCAYAPVDVPVLAVAEGHMHRHLEDVAIIRAPVFAGG